MSDTAGFVVVDIWRAKPGKRDELNSALATTWTTFMQDEGVVSIDYTTLKDDPDRYLVVFRYRDAAAREAFVRTPELTSTMEKLADLWDLESPIY